MNRLFCYIFTSLVIAGVMAFGGVAMAMDPASERSDGFKASKRAAGVIQEALENGNVTAAIEPATSMAVFAARIPSLFPPGSNGGFFSKARDEIWRNFPDFEEKSRVFQARAQSLAELAASDHADSAQVADAFGKVMESCKDCHRTYKAGR